MILLFDGKSEHLERVRTESFDLTSPRRLFTGTATLTVELNS